MINKFKAGDKIRLIKGQRPSSSNLVYGKEYTVLKTEISNYYGPMVIFHDGYKEVDLKEVRFELVKPALDFMKPVFSEGKPVTIITTKGRNTPYPVLTYVGDETSITYFTKEGNLFAGGTDYRDLTNESPVQKEKDIYVTVHRTAISGELYVGGFYNTEEQAKENSVEGTTINKFTLTKA